MVIYPIILVIVKHFVIFHILRMYIMLCQPFCFISFSFFYRLVSIRSICILQVICKTPTLLNVIMVVVELIRGPIIEARVD